MPPPPAVAEGTLAASVTLKANVKDLRGTPTEAAARIGGETVTFAGDPGIAAGDLFVLTAGAFRAVSVTLAGSTATVTTELPAVDDVLDDVVLNGVTDLRFAKFVPAQSFAEAGTARALSARPAARPSAQPSALPVSNVFRVETRRGYTGITNDVKIGDSDAPGLQASLNTFIAGNFSAEKWSAAGRSGNARLRLNMELDASVRMAAAVLPDDGACAGEGSTGGGRFYIGALHIPTDVPGVTVDVPLCLAFPTRANISIELLRYRRVWDTTINIEGGSPTANVVAVDSATPPIDGNQTIDTASLQGGAAFSGSIGAYLETGAQLNVFKILAVGAQVQLGAEANGTFLAGPTFTTGTLRQADTSPGVCFKIATDWKGTVSGYAAWLGVAKLKQDLYRGTIKIRDYAMGLGPGCGVEVLVDPKGSFVPISNLDQANPATSISLSQIPGALVTGFVDIATTGGWIYNTSGAYANSSSAVFRNAAGTPLATDYSLGSFVTPFVTPSCGASGATDIPEDFAISPGPPYFRVKIPAGATSIALSTGDCYYKDNTSAAVPLKIFVRASQYNF